MTTFEPCSYDEFKQQAAEFFNSLDNATDDQANAGVRALYLLFVSATGWTDFEAYQAEMLVEMAARKALEKELA